MRVVILDTDFPDLEFERSIAEGHDVTLEMIEPERVRESSDVVDAIVTMWSVVDAAMIESLPRLRVIGRIGLGVDAIDVEAATERGIAVVNSGDYATEEVAVHAIALVLALVRGIVGHDDEIRRGGWVDRDLMAGMRRLSTLTVGVVGLGKIGCRVGEMLSALGMKVVGYDPGRPQCGLDEVQSLTQLLSVSDVVTLHVPLSDATRGLLGEAEMRAMRHGALLVNCARGEVLDQAALVDFLKAGRIGGAALDVFAVEPLGDSALKTMPNVVLSPHVAYYSPEAVRDARERTMSGVLSVLAGGCPTNQINQIGDGGRPTHEAGNR